jgi:sulfur carrier protein ThiS
MGSQLEYIYSNYLNHGEKGGRTILITVRLKGILASSSGFREREMDVEEGIDIYGLLEVLQITMKPSWLITSMNNRMVKKSVVLKEGDIIEIFIAGGGG